MSNEDKILEMLEKLTTKVDNLEKNQALIIGRLEMLDGNYKRIDSRLRILEQNVANLQYNVQSLSTRAFA